MSHRARRDRAPNAGRLAAIAVACLSGAFVAALGIFGYARNRLTPHEVVAGFVVLVVGAVAALIAGQWNRRHGGRQS